MSRYYSKRNKHKVWLKTYGKPFVVRRALKIVMASVINAQGVASIGFVAGSFGDPLGKAVAIGNITVSTAKALSELSLNDGFMTKEQSKC